MEPFRLQHNMMSSQPMCFNQRPSQRFVALLVEGSGADCPVSGGQHQLCLFFLDAEPGTLPRLISESADHSRFHSGQLATRCAARSAPSSTSLKVRVLGCFGSRSIHALLG